MIGSNARVSTRLWYVLEFCLAAALLIGLVAHFGNTIPCAVFSMSGLGLLFWFGFKRLDMRDQKLHETWVAGAGMVVELERTKRLQK